jgi:hypothetical protein
MPVHLTGPGSLFRRIGAALAGDAPGNDNDPADPTARGSTVIAPDGMVRNMDVRPTGLSRADLIKAAKTAGVPQREQQGPTCGLYALGMIMDCWHERDARNPTALVQDLDRRGKGRQYTIEPTTDERILNFAKEAGYTALGEMFTARQLAATARHFGYDATTHENATLDDLYRVLDAGHPALVAFDVDYNGNPTDAGGARAHYAVIEGYFDQGGERYLVARHGWAVQQDHVWKAADFDRSWKALQATDFYGTPGDGVIPAQPKLGLRQPMPEPSAMKLPDAGNGQAGIRESLGTKIIEVVPRGEEPVGGTRDL